MRRLVLLVAALMLPLSACLSNQSIDDEMASKCGISATEYKRADASLNAEHVGMSLIVGQCRLTRTTKNVIKGTMIAGS